jgi:hypothetical protein
MEGTDVKRLGLIFSVQAEIEAMKCENETRKQAGESMAYSGEDFQTKAHELSAVSYCHADEL